MAKAGQRVVGAKVAVLGLSFKENCPDLRTTKVVDASEASHQYGLEVVSSVEELGRCQAVVLAVAHEQFAALEVEQWQQLAPDGVLMDLKGIVPRWLQPLRL